MDKDKVEIKYCGNAKIICYCPEFSGLIKKGDSIFLSKDRYEKELKSHPLWKIIKKVKTKDKK